MPQAFTGPVDGGTQTQTTAGPPGLGQQQGTYGFSAGPRGQMSQTRRRPRALQQAMVTEGETSKQPRYGNLMHDSHVIRGNTYAQPVVNMNSQPDPIEIQRQQELRRRALAKRRAMEQQRPKTPEAVAGRQHMSVQTEKFLEELSNKIIEVDVGCQTDDFLDRPPTPLFIPVKTGVDVETQIYQGDLFDFDVESKPLVAVLVGKSIEQALVEVCEEEELISLRQRHEEYAELRMAEAIEAQRLEEQERRLRTERDNRLAQMKEAEQIRRVTLQKVQSHAFAKSYMDDLVPSIFGKLESTRYFPDVARKEVDCDFMPLLLECVTEMVGGQLTSMDILDEMIVLAIEAAYSDFTEDLDPVEPTPGKNAPTETDEQAVSIKSSATDGDAKATGEDIVEPQKAEVEPQEDIVEPQVRTPSAPGVSPDTIQEESEEDKSAVKSPEGSAPATEEVPADGGTGDGKKLFGVTEDIEEAADDTEEVQPRAGDGEESETGAAPAQDEGEGNADPTGGDDAKQAGVAETADAAADENVADGNEEEAPAPGATTEEA